MHLSVFIGGSSAFPARIHREGLRRKAPVFRMAIWVFINRSCAFLMVLHH